MKRVDANEFFEKIKNGTSGREPSEDDVLEYMKLNNESYYASREILREQAYGGKPPLGYPSGRLLEILLNKVNFFNYFHKNA